ncbi:nuclear pore complex protein DDB_G0274915-like isoform X1 [Cataglyphis hispanica]|uniref:nuclear pore complex protein DDB_G0274915-like isoform X1 n=1 Tax=Cataglyphis hispanica TaxID=1086592 RepID=UPI00217FDA59|nr:nuclear pore complex protein DDB_G0274915-like isoform X1 [Cataglyphis hispanica]
MVICKYYRQGNCRYGQYCQFEHINNFAGNTKTDHNEDDIAVTVAKEVLLAERGGQWLLSCFGPFRDRPIIPGMEDLSPEEVRCEIYEAQKSGMVEQAKLNFQRLCQDMKAKREALKNPTRETIAMLKKILGSSQKGGLNVSDNTAKKSSTFSFTAPHLGLVNNASTNNVFGNKTFGVQNNNPFGGGGFTSSNNTSIFGKTNNNSTSVFGNTATFGNNLGGFATTTNATNSFFGGTTNTSTSFNSIQNNTSTFGTPQNNPIFGGSSQTVFGQNNNVFGTTNQLGNAPSTSLFNNPMTSQANTSLFGGATTTTPNLFGGSSSTGLQANSVFGASTTSSGSSFSGGIFNQPKTQVPAFGGAPVFGGVTSNYANNSNGNSIFGVNQTFGATTAIPTTGIFGGSTVAATPAFGVSAATTTPAFGTSVTTTPAFDLNQQHGNNTFGTTAPASNVFGGTQNTDATMSVGTGNAPFGTSITAGPFVTVNSQQYDSTGATSTPFASTGFGIAVASTNSTFGTTETSSNSIFANAGTTFATSNATIPNPSFPTSTFGNINASSSTSSTTLTTTTNPFASRMQQGNSPFGNVAQTQSGPILSSPFGKSPFNATTNTVIDDTVYSVEGALTDDEKSMYLAEKFIIGKIPLKPPTKDIR